MSHHQKHHKPQTEEPVNNEPVAETNEPETQETAEPLEEAESCGEEEATVETAQEAEIEKWKDLAMRAQAEMENLRKRTQIDIEKANRYANTSFARDLLPVADYLANAIDYAQKEIEKTQAEQSECSAFLVNLLKGVEMTQKQLQTVFEKHQIVKMEALGTVFDPNLHKVIQEVEDADKESGTIVQELQSGYTIGGERVLREAMVIVSK